jgi:hypothetical protein
VCHPAFSTTKTRCAAALLLPPPFGELAQRHGEQLGVDRGQDQPIHLPAFGAHESIEVGPLVAPLEPSDRPPCILAFGRTLRPYGRDRPMPPWSRSQDRWEAEVVAPVV